MVDKRRGSSLKMLKVVSGTKTNVWNFWCLCHDDFLVNLVEETDDLAGDVLPPRLFVVHDTRRGGEHNVAELTRRQELDDPLLEIAELDVVAGGDDTSLVETSVELDDDLAVAVVIDLLELANVT